LQTGKFDKNYCYHRRIFLLKCLQPKFDDELESRVAEIDEKYPVGICADHADKQCFHHRPTDNHFIFDRPKKLVWAAAIVSFNLWALHLIITNNLLQRKGTSTIASIPIGSNLFSAAQAAKKPVKSSLPNPDAAIPATPVPATPTHPPSIPFQPHYLPFPPCLHMLTICTIIRSQTSSTCHR
jgi:hypothetical protein